MQPRAIHVVLALAILPACSREAPPVPRPAIDSVTVAAPAAPAREVFRLEPDGGGGYRVSGVVPTPEARSLLLAEIRRQWPGRRLDGGLEIERDSPALWVPEAMALMPYAAGVERGGLVVRAETGASGGGVLAIHGRVADEMALARLAADAEASVAPPFLVQTPVDIGLAADSSDASTVTDTRPAVVAGSAEADGIVADARSALADASLTFRPGTAVLEPGSMEGIATLAEVLRVHPSVHVEVLAHGEGTGSPSLERELAARRAAAIVDALREEGVAAERSAASGQISGESPVTFRLSIAASN